MKVKIDLHLHSKISRNDPIHWDSDYDSISRLKNEGIKIAAFSDHYSFSVEFYLEIKKLAATAGILILPAIEINVLNSNQKKADIIFIFSE
ncbi:MAG: PHP domain-containing protein [Mycoplasmataceae bacterium]|nr:PHP domain-containing protein [Mycoplasmataceae bacterium]